MAGEFLVELKKQRIFRQPVMDAIVNEFAPETDQFKVTDAFMPFQLVDSEDFIDMVEFGVFGRTYPVQLGAEHRRIDLPGYLYKEQAAGYWREGMVFNEEVLQKAVNPQRPLERMAEGLVTRGLNALDLRLNNLIETLSVAVVIQGYYSEARYGVNYEYDPQIPPYQFIDITQTTGAHQIQWSGSGGVWTTGGSAKPLVDIKGAANFAQSIGINPRRIWMNDHTWQLVEDANDTVGRYVYVPDLTLRNITDANVLERLAKVKGLVPVVDQRIAYEEGKVTAASSAGANTITVSNVASFRAGDKVIIKKSDGRQMFDVVASVSGNTLTLTDSAGLKYSVAIGDRVIRSRKRFPDNYFVIEGDRFERATPNRWVSTPSLVKAQSWSRVLPGKYTWTYFQERVPYLLEIGAGVNGGPRVTLANWIVVKVGANSEYTWK